MLLVITSSALLGSGRALQSYWNSAFSPPCFSESLGVEQVLQRKGSLIIVDVGHSGFRACPSFLLYFLLDDCTPNSFLREKDTLQVAEKQEGQVGLKYNMHYLHSFSNSRFPNYFVPCFDLQKTSMS